MSAAGPVVMRPDLSAMVGYHSPQVDAEVRLNTNESPIAPPGSWSAELAREIGRIELNRYPDRRARKLREALASYHDVSPEQVFCANGSNEVIQCLLLAFGGPGRKALVFEPTYALHSHIARVTGTGVCSAPRDESFRIDPDAAVSLFGAQSPEVTFVCSPNNPTGAAEDPGVVAAIEVAAPGLVVVDEAYGQFARWSALDLLRDAGPGGHLVVTRTFSKTWAMAGCRLGYLVGTPAVVEACEAVALPYHLSSLTQAAGLLALGYAGEMERRVAAIVEERGRVAAALSGMAVTTWPSEANFILLRPDAASSSEVWERLLSQSVLVRDCSTWPGVEGCLRVTIGTPAENDRFLEALDSALAGSSPAGSSPERSSPERRAPGLNGTPT
ncbi:MAG: histidinol-phosphate transaminase [Acidimicrobiales bacterium]